jgi:hypothetical protein
MENKRRMRLRAERLGELTPDDLKNMAAGWDTKTVICLTGIYPTLPVQGCLTNNTGTIIVPPTE